MPLFDFTCTKCGGEFEELLRNEAGAQSPSCPHCGSKETIRNISAPSPLKTGAFPFKPGPVRPMSYGGAPSCSSGSQTPCATCASKHN